MILFTILAIMFVMLVAITILAVATGGVVFIIVFADVIVCAVIIGFIMKHLIGRKKK